jgi:hypothetical protein
LYLLSILLTYANSEIKDVLLSILMFSSLMVSVTDLQNVNFSRL